MQDATTHANWVDQLKAFHLEDNAPTTSGLVFAKMIAPKGATKIKRKARPRSKGQNAAAKAMQQLARTLPPSAPSTFNPPTSEWSNTRLRLQQEGGHHLAQRPGGWWCTVCRSKVAK